MRASLNDRPAGPKPILSRKRRRAREAASKHLEAFLEMLAAERGAAALTLAAYRNDLSDFALFLAPRGLSLEAADSAALHAYLASATGLAPRTLARRISALRQFYKFLMIDGIRHDDPAGDLETPGLGRALPAFPHLISVLDRGTIYRRRDLDIAFAARSAAGELFAPVVRGVDRLSTDAVARGERIFRSDAAGSV